MELLLFLILGGILLSRVGADRSKIKKSNRTIEKDVSWHESRQQSWRESVSDRALEEDLWRFIANPENYDDVWCEVKSAYLHMAYCPPYTSIAISQSMIDEEYGKGSLTPKQRENIVKTNRKKALNIMLARRGKVCDADTWGQGSVASLAPGEGQHSKEAWNETFSFWLYIRDELRRNGVPARLIFKTGGFQEHLQTAYDADDVELFRYQHGVLTWLPLTYFDDELNHA